MSDVRKRPMNGDTQRGSNPVLWTVLGTLLGLILLYAATRKVDASLLLATLHSADLRWGFAFLVIIAGFTILKAIRWKLLLCFIPNLKFGTLHSAVYVGLGVNFLIAHIGEFMRAALVARGSQVSVSSVLATVVVERALDFVAFLVVISVFSMFAANLPEFVGMAGMITSIVAVIAIAGLYAFLHTPDWLVRLVASICQPLSAGMRAWCVKQIELFRNGLVALQDLQMMITIIAISVLQWALVVAAIWASVTALGESVSIVALVATFVLVLIGLTLPNSPMQIGTTQMAFTIGLGTGGVMATTAVAASLIYTLFLIVPIMIVGGICLIQVRRSSVND